MVAMIMFFEGVHKAHILQYGDWRDASSNSLMLAGIGMMLVGWAGMRLVWFLLRDDSFIWRHHPVQLTDTHLAGRDVTARELAALIRTVVGDLPQDDLPRWHGDAMRALARAKQAGFLTPEDDKAG